MSRSDCQAGTTRLSNAVYYPPRMAETRRTLRGKVAVAGIGETTHYKHGQSPDPEFKLALKAILRACEERRHRAARDRRLRILFERPQRALAPGGVRPARAAPVEHTVRQTGVVAPQPLLSVTRDGCG
jgi:hypothetical protein